jgi:hypothetical protein
LGRLYFYADIKLVRLFRGYYPDSPDILQVTLVLRIGCGVLFVLLAACGDEGASKSSTLSNSATSASTTPTVSATPATATLTSATATSGAATSATATSAAATSAAATSATATPATANLAVMTSVLSAAAENTAYIAKLAVTGGKAPYSWALSSGALPTGMALSSSGVVSGTPGAAGTARFSVLVTDSSSPARTSAAPLTLNVTVAPLIISTAVLPYATAGTGLTTTLAAAGGSGAYTWSLKSGILPAGLTLGSSGVLSGMPTTVGIFPFSATVVDAGTPQHTASQVFNLIVSASGTTTQVTLAATPSNISIDSTFAGLSYEKYEMSQPLFSPDNSTLIALFNRLGPGLLRIGGNSVDHTVWNATELGEAVNQVSPSEVDRLAGFLRACNWQVLYGIEFLNENTSPVTKADPSLVAAEAVYAMQSLGDSLYGFELGNEPDLYSFDISTFTYSTFQSDWETYRKAILAAVDAAKAAGTLPQSATPRFTGPAISYLESYVAAFAASESQNISLLTRHYYRADGQNASSTMSLLLEPDPNLPSELATMATSATSNNIALGYRISEANSFYDSGKPGVSNAFGSALWIINFLFENAWAGSSGVNFHGGWSGSYSPIFDNGHAAIGVEPEYYGIYLFSQAANGRLIATTIAPESDSLYAYAVGGAGTTHVMLVNTSATTSYNANIQFNGSVSSATYVTLTGPSLTAISGTLMNGTAIEPSGDWPEAAPPALVVTAGSLEVPVPAGSAILLNAQ